MPHTTKQPKGLGGRPRLDTSERRCRQTNTRWTISEDQAIRASAAAAGITVGEYIRRRALSLPVIAKHARADSRLVHELNAIGVNLNQIARNMNAGREGVGAVDLGELCVLLREVLGRAIEQLDD